MLPDRGTEDWALRKGQRCGHGKQYKKIEAPTGDACRDDECECQGDHQGDAVQHARD